MFEFPQYLQRFLKRRGILDRNEIFYFLLFDRIVVFLSLNHENHVEKEYLKIYASIFSVSIFSNQCTR